MKRGFYTIMAAQFFSSLADNALFFAAVALIQEMEGPAWMPSMTKWGFALAYVSLAAFVGAFADSYPKGKVMFATNIVKVVGCFIIFFYDFFPLYGNGEFWFIFFGFMVVGVGAAMYSPAKYGILTELLPPGQLVKGNGWIEGLTIASIIFGTVLGGQLISPKVSSFLLSLDLPFIDTGIDTAPEAAILVVSLLYVVAALFNLGIPDTGARYPKQERNPWKLISEFWCNVAILWKDKLGQITLAVTTLFWGAAATLQLMVIDWGQQQLHLRLDQTALLQGVTGLGTIIGAIIAGRTIVLKRSLSVLPCGIAMGVIVMLIPLAHSIPVVVLLLLAAGGMGGFFVVPMNALLQHRGHLLMSAGHSIAVQNFNEQLNILVMLAMYSLLLSLKLPINGVLALFGGIVAVLMVVIMRWNRANHDADPRLTQIIGMEKGESATQYVQRPHF